MRTLTVYSLKTEVQNPARKPAAKYDWHERPFPPGFYIVESWVDTAAIDMVKPTEEQRTALTEKLRREQIWKIGDPNSRTAPRLEPGLPIADHHPGFAALRLALQPVSPNEFIPALAVRGIRDGDALEILEHLVACDALSIETVLAAAEAAGVTRD